MTSSITQQIKDFVINECGMDKVGIAGIDRFNESPEGLHPTDFLPGCKSVIAFCVRLPDGAVNATFRTFEDRMYDLHGIYGAYGYVGAPNYELLFANYKLARLVEKLTGCAAMPNTAGPTHGAKMMSMRIPSAFAASTTCSHCSLVISCSSVPRMSAYSIRKEPETAAR